MTDRTRRLLLLALLGWGVEGCALLRWGSRAIGGAVEGGVWVARTSYVVTAGTLRTVYRIGEFTYEVVKAPVEWGLTHEEIESIDGLPAKEAIRQGRVKYTPYVVHGTRYVPISPEQARGYREEGIASWYGYESGRMTANGEAFDPNGLTAAHKYLPLPIFVQVTNLANGRAAIVRVNDRGPFPSSGNPRSGERVIDLSQGAARRLGFERQGTARVRIEAIALREEAG